MRILINAGNLLGRFNVNGEGILLESGGLLFGGDW